MRALYDFFFLASEMRSGRLILRVWVLAALWLAGMCAAAQEYSFRTFMAAEGLSNLSIQKLYQDRSGFIWVSTENGIFRYDGDRFEVFGAEQGMPPAGRAEFGEAPDGALLVGADFGLYRLQGKRFEKVNAPFQAVNWSQGIAPDGHGRTYVSTPEGLFVMSNAAKGYAFERVYPKAKQAPEEVHAVLVDGDAVWFACEDSICRIEKGKLTVLGEKSGLQGMTAVTILKDRRGNLWARVKNEGLMEWPAGEAGFRRPDTPIPGRLLTGTPALDRDGRVMLGTPSGLLIGNDRQWQFVNQRVGLRGGVFTTLEDRQGSLWLGTGGRGLVQWRGYREWEGYTSSSGLPGDNAYEMLPQADGSVWVGTEGGLAKGTSKDEGFTWAVVEATRGTGVHSLQPAKDGDIWLGTTAKGVGLLHTKTGKVEWYDALRGLPARLALTLRMDTSGRLWAATDLGLFAADAPYDRFSRVAILPPTWFWTVTEGTDGTIWAGGVDGLFARVQGRWQRMGTADGLSNQAVTAIGADRDGWVWVGYQHGGGIDRVRVSTHGIEVQKKVQRQGSDGLIYFLRFDHAGRLWAGTERGLDVWDGKYWRHYDMTDGLIWDDCDLGGFAAGPDGTLWIGTSGGLARFRPRARRGAEVDPQVLFTEVRVGDRDVSLLKRPSFPVSAGALVVRFAAPAAVQDTSLVFRYRLEGNKSTWTETTQRQLEFAKLASGRYDLQVQARDSRGMWSEDAAEFAFSIESPWYRRGWFIALLTLVPFLGAVFFFRARAVRAQKREERLQAVVEERTSDLRKANEELLRLTMLDALTGVANRRHFDQTLEQECARVRRSGGVVSLVMVDADHFKALNDSAGHQQGDAYLVAIGQELMRIARRKIDVAARIGGEEFALILPATDAKEATRIAEKVRAEVEALALKHPASDAAVLTVSVGVATATKGDACVPEELMAAADKALYRAKSLGRNRVEVA